MASLDIFNSDAFTTIELIAAIEKVDYQPQFLGSLNLFEPMPLRTKTAYVEERSGVLSLIQTTPRGAPLAQRTNEKRTARSFNTVRIAKQDRIMADEIQSVRAFGSETELMQMQTEVMRRLAGPAGLQSEVELTWENMRLGAVQGIVTDADGSTIVNFFTEFGVAQPAEVNLDIANTATGDLKPKVAANIVRPMTRASKGAMTPASRIVALCGDTFFDDLTSHEEVRQSYLNYSAAADLRKGTQFDTPFPWGGVDWINYRGTDDNSTVAVNTDKAKFFPVNAPGVFKVAWAPAEFFDTVNMPGVPLTPKIVIDDDRLAWVDIEVYSYPLFICTRPSLLFRAKRA